MKSCFGCNGKETHTCRGWILQVNVLTIVTVGGPIFLISIVR